MLPNRFDITFVQGKTFKFWIALELANGTVLDLPTEGYGTAKLQVRAGYGTPVLLTLSTANGGIVLAKQFDKAVGDPTRKEWSGYLYVPASTLAAIQPWGQGVYDLEAYATANPTNEVLDWMRGYAVLESEVTV